MRYALDPESAMLWTLGCCVTTCGLTAGGCTSAHGLPIGTAALSCTVFCCFRSCFHSFRTNFCSKDDELVTKAEDMPMKDQESLSTNNPVVEMMMRGEDGVTNLSVEPGAEGKAANPARRVSVMTI